MQAPGGGARARAPVPQLVTHGGFTILKPDTHWRQSRKDVRRLGDKNYSLSTKSTELNMFNFGDNVDRDTVDKVERAGDSRLSANRRQTGDKPATKARYTPWRQSRMLKRLSCQQRWRIHSCSFYNVVHLT